MARDGSGNYSLPAGNPVVTGTTISSTWANATMPDVGTAITNSLAKDGQTTPTANLPMGGNRHTGVADGQLSNQYASVGQAQNGSLFKVGSVANATDAFTGSIAPAIAAYTDGLLVTMTPNITNTTTGPTLALNGLTAKPIYKEGGVVPAIGDLLINVAVLLQYSTQAGGGWLLLNPQVVTSARLTPIADGKLSANVPLLNAANIFTATQTINPAAATVGLTINGVATSFAAACSGVLTAGQSFGLFIAAGTNSSDKSLQVVNAAGSTSFFLIRGDGSWFFDNTVGGVFSGTGPVTCAGTLTLTSGLASKGDTLLVRSMNSAGTTVMGYGSVKAWAGSGTNVTDAAIGSVGDLFMYANNTITPSIHISVGSVQIADENNVLQDAGFRGLPQVSTAGNRTCIISDRGKHIYVTGASTQTIPANASVPYAVGDSLTFINATGSGNVSIAITTNTLIFAANNTTGTRTLAAGGMATAVKVTATSWHISGAGLS